MNELTNHDRVKIDGENIKRKLAMEWAQTETDQKKPSIALIGYYILKFVYIITLICSLFSQN